MLQCLTVLCVMGAAIIQPVHGDGDVPEVRLSVKAHIGSSVHIEWEKIPNTDPRYISFAKKENSTTSAGLKKGEEIILLPYGLLVKFQNNDPKKVVKLHVEDLKTTGGKHTVSAENLSVCANGSPYQSLKDDVILLGPESGSEPKEIVLLFRLHTTLADKSGEYSAKFSFITSEVL